MKRSIAQKHAEEKWKPIEMDKETVLKIINNYNKIKGAEAVAALEELKNKTHDNKTASHNKTSNQLTTKADKTSSEASSMVSSIVNSDACSAVIRFSGHFCFTCGLNDYFDDFVIEAENHSLNLSIREIKRDGEDSYLVEFEKVYE